MKCDYTNVTALYVNVSLYPRNWSTKITILRPQEEQSTNTQAAAYNVDIVHPIVELPSCPRERLTMKWSSPKNAQVYFKNIYFKLMI